MLTTTPATRNDLSATSADNGKMPTGNVFISGFMVIRNAVVMKYPVSEAIKSILPIVDEFVVAVGAGDDNTRDLISAIDSPKIRIVDTVWDRANNHGGHILAEKTNEALAMCRGTWCFYLQADEVVHEHDLAAIRAACDLYATDLRVEALLFPYMHFYGSFHVVAKARNWYRNEVRIVRNGIGARSIGDAQSFSVHNRKPHVARVAAHIMHYGWAKPPSDMGRKISQFAFWYEGGFVQSDRPQQFQFRQLYGLAPFAGTHPGVMKALVEAQDWKFTPRFVPTDWSRKDWKNFISDGFEFLTRRRWGERKQYRLVK